MNISQLFTPEVTSNVVSLVTTFFIIFFSIIILGYGPNSRGRRYGKFIVYGQIKEVEGSAQFDPYFTETVTYIIFNISIYYKTDSIKNENFKLE